MIRFSDKRQETRGTEEGRIAFVFGVSVGLGEGPGGAPRACVFKEEVFELLTFK